MSSYACGGWPLCQWIPMTISVARLHYKVRNQINISAQLRKRRRSSTRDNRQMGDNRADIRLKVKQHNFKSVNTAVK